MAANAAPDRMLWAMETPAPGPDDHLLEIGGGPGVAVSLICEKLDGGRIVDRGTHDELIRRSPLYAEIAEYGCEDVLFLQRDLEEREEVASL